MPFWFVVGMSLSNAIVGFTGSHMFHYDTTLEVLHGDPSPQPSGRFGFHVSLDRCMEGKLWPLFPNGRLVPFGKLSHIMHFVVMEAARDKVSQKKC